MSQITWNGQFVCYIHFQEETMFTDRLLSALVLLLTLIAMPVYGQEKPKASLHLTHITGFPVSKIGAPVITGVGVAGVWPVSGPYVLVAEWTATTPTVTFTPTSVLTIGGSRNHSRFGIALNGLYRVTPRYGETPAVHAVGGTLAPSVLIVPGLRVAFPIVVAKPLGVGPITISLVFKLILKVF